ncbi:MAG TPA: serine/threonine-protein kinase [Gemmatimonadaceae bacterium]|nr:serine/threonine-protein kinase [Gemmatimonadaceae bacterium]
MSGFAEHLQEALGSAYRLERELAGGGMSRVFVATDLALGRTVVVKVLPPELAAGVNRERFRREIQVAAQLQHPHIVPLLSAGERDDLLWYTMPFIEGESLKAALERGQQFSARDIIRILHDVVDALAFAHARGVIHRDIKPANILTQGSHALVTDFGVAKAISAAMPISGFTSGGIAIGTPAYMAPEQLAGDSAADHRMDIYAVGLLAYELATGESPFTGPSPRETLAAQLTRDPKPLHELAPAIPRSLSDLIMRCLAKDPARRPANADEILRELDALTMPLGVTPAAGVPSRGSRTWMSVAAVAILFAVLAGVGYVVARQRQALPPVIPPVAPIARQQAAPESVVKRSAAAAGLTAAPAPRPVISHKDSLAIAEAVRRKLEDSKIRDSVAKARLAEETQRRMMDSIIAANSGGVAAPASRKRVAIVEPDPVASWPEAELLGRAVADSLRRMLRQRPQFRVVDQDSVRQELTVTHAATDVARALNADLIVVIRLQPFRSDSGMLIVQALAPGSTSRYGFRGFGSRPVPKSEVLANLDERLLATVDELQRLARAPIAPPTAIRP